MIACGANTTIFSVVNSVLLRPLPYEKPDRIVPVSDLVPVTGGIMTSSFPKFTFLHQYARSYWVLRRLERSSIPDRRPRARGAREVSGVRVSADFQGGDLRLGAANVDAAASFPRHGSVVNTMNLTRVLVTPDAK